jgi:hypothetical protein
VAFLGADPSLSRAQSSADPSAFDRPSRDAYRSSIYCIPRIITRAGDGDPVSRIQSNSIPTAKLHQAKGALLDLNFLVSRVEQSCGDKSIRQLLHSSIHSDIKASEEVGSFPLRGVAGSPSAPLQTR